MTSNDSDPVRSRDRSLGLTRYGVGLAAVWTIVIVLLGLWNAHEATVEAREMIRSEARAHFLKDQAFRNWAAGHGGVYVPVDDDTPPNPYLSHIQERDVETRSGRNLTLMNPAYMVRQLMEEFSHEYGIRGNITSLKPLRPENAPDPWERAALEQFETGVTEVSEFTDLDGETHLRLMRPMTVKSSCLKCHAHQGYREGDVRGGVGLAIPTAPFFARADRDITIHSLGLGLLWLVGLAGILANILHLRHRTREREEAERALRQSETLFRAITEQSGEGLALADTDGNYTMVNAALCRMTGYSEPELMAMNVRDLVPTGTELTIFARILENEEERRELNLVRRDGSRFPAEVSGYPVQLADRRLALGIVRDITDRKQAEDERLALERTVQRTQQLESLCVMAGGIAHDFNNILMAILGNVDLALSDLPSLSPVRDNLNTIEVAARRAADLAQQMLAYSGQGRFIIEPIDAGKLLREAARLLEVSLPKGVLLNVNLAETLPTFDGDESQIRAVIMNLATNASEAIGDAHGVISLSTGVMDCGRAYLDGVEDAVLFGLEEPLPTGPYVYFEVSDTGCGMDEDTRNRLFEPFYTTKFTGRGLGLSTVLGTVRSHGGAIRFMSQAGKGSVFKVLFPVSPEVAQAKQPDARDPEIDPEWSGRGTILLVDDDPEIRTVATQILKRMQFTVLTAGDGREALQVFRRQADDIDAVLLDLTMPHVNGEEAFREMQLIRPGVPVILCSGYHEREATQGFAGLGLAGFLQKPYSISELKKMLRKALLDAGTESR